MSDTTETPKDILELANDPELLAIAGRQASYMKHIKGRGIQAGQGAEDLLFALNALRSLLQQNHDLREDEGELEYIVVRRSRHDGFKGHTYLEPHATIKDAHAFIERLRSGDSELLRGGTYEIVAVRRLVVQTVTASG
jgi:hypothetical protein